MGEKNLTLLKNFEIYMKSNLIHVCFIIDKSGSMFSSKEDVVGGFNKTIEEQRAVKDGECVVSLFTFNDNVKQVFLGRKLDEIKPLTCNVEPRFYGLCNTVQTVVTTSWDGTKNMLNQSSVSEYKSKENDYNYSPEGLTAMNDGIGTAIDKIGVWLADMPEEERPSKNLIVIMTDGCENASKEYTLKRVKEMIQHQTEVYNWSFVYMGTDVNTVETAENLGINMRSFSSRRSDDTYANYSNISKATTAYRCSDDIVMASATMDCCLTENLKKMTKSYEDTLGFKIEK